MDIRIESNIGLDIFDMNTIQESLVLLKNTYTDAPLLMIRCNQSNDIDNSISMMLTLFNQEKTEILTGSSKDAVGLLESLILNMVELKKKKDFPFTPIRINNSLRSAS